MLLEHSGAKICDGSAFQPIQNLCHTKQLIWTPTSVMQPGMLLERSGTKVAASDWHAARGKGLLLQICDGSAFQPIQNLCSAKQPIWTPTSIMSVEMLLERSGAK
eukprot:3935294-Rhodomonas_salina.2